MDISIQEKPQASLLVELRSLPRAFWVLVAGWFVNRFGTFVGPFLTLFLTQNGHGPGSVAWVLCAQGVGVFVASLVGGYWADRVGRRTVIVVGTLGNAAAILSLYFMHDLWAVAGMMCVAGFAAGFYQPASGALLADLVPEPLRVRAYSVQRLAINAGFACGASAAGFLLTFSTFALFAGDAVTTAAFGMVALWMLPQGLRASGEEATWGEAWRYFRRDRPFWGLCAATALSSYIFMQFGSTFGLELQRRGVSAEFFGWHLNAAQLYGLVLGLNGVMVALFELPLTRWTQRFSPRRMVAVGYTLMGGSFALNALPGGLALPLMVIVLFTIGEMLSQPVRSAYIMQLAPTHLRGRYMGAAAMAGTLSGIFGPHLSLRWHASSPVTFWLAMAGVGAASALALVLGGERRSDG